MQCPVCLDNFTSINILSCSHPLCSGCRQNWTQSCPLCRNNSHILSVNNINETICKLPCYPSEKNTSCPITPEEIIMLKNIFGNFEKSKFHNIPIGSKILYQNFASNCWWFGTLVQKRFYSLQIDNSIYYNRNNGNIYKATPSIRTIDNSDTDQIFLVC